MDKLLVNAAKIGNLKTVKSLVSQGADICAKGKHAFRLAAENGHLEVVEFLVSKGADVHTDDDYVV